MAKIKATLTGTVNHTQADCRIHRSEVCAGGAGDTLVHVQSNSKSLNSMIESASVRDQDVYDWKTGTMTKKKLDVLANARRNINTLCVHPVTNARAREDEKSGMGSSPTCCEYGSTRTYPPSGRRK
jgi:hypothetical protein